MPDYNAPFIDPSQYSNFMPQSYYQNAVSSRGGHQDPNTGFLGENLDNGPFGGLFTSKPEFKTYSKNGLIYSTSPTRANPTPQPTVPGAPIKPSRVYKKTAQSTQAITDLLPYLMQAVNAGAVPSAIANYNASAATSGPYAQLMTQLYNQYGPQLNAIGNEIQKRNALAQADRDNAVLQGPGKDLVKSSYDLSQVYDKPWYDTRNAGASRIQDLLSSIDLKGGLSPTERDEIQKGISRQGSENGTLGAPSATNTAANAMQFGNAGRQRVLQNQDSLSKAIQSAAAFLPTAKSGVDVFQVATGRSSQPNPGAAQFPGIAAAPSSQGGYGLAGNLLNNNAQMQMQSSQLDSQKKDWLDQFSQFTSGLGSIAGIAGGAMGMCWVAREVYGVENPKWLLFRNWMMNKAPFWFFKLYAIYGERFAKWISNKPKLKSLIKLWMNNRIGEQ